MRFNYDETARAYTRMLLPTSTGGSQDFIFPGPLARFQRGHSLRAVHETPLFRALLSLLYLASSTLCSVLYRSCSGRVPAFGWLSLICGAGANLFEGLSGFACLNNPTARAARSACWLPLRPRRAALSVGAVRGPPARPPPPSWL